MKVLKGVISSSITVTALFKENVDGTVGAACPEIPGCTVTGRSRRDATQKIKAAVEACLTKLLEDARAAVEADAKRLGNKRRTAGRP